MKGVFFRWIIGAGAVSNITNQISEGFNQAHGYWNGSSGITSTTAQSATNLALGVELNNNGSGGTFFSSFDGIVVTSTDVIVKYTYFGDADLSGNVTGSDYTLIDSGFNNRYTGWHNGDFNYDGVVNGDDYTLIDNSFNTQGGVTLGESAPENIVAADTDQIVHPLAVPEPGTISLLIAGAAGLSMRRRRY